MNISVYLFGSFKSGYSQYPNDYAKTIFEKFYQNAKSTTQVAIHRDGDLMYYGYIRKLETGNYLGLCTVINGKFLFTIDPLFSVYEGIVELMVKNGYLIHFGNNGELTTSTHKLYENAEEISLITTSLQNSFDRLEEKALPLPPLNYGISKGTIKSYSIQDNSEEIIKSSYTNSFTFIYKSKGFNSAALNSYIEIVGRKNKEISSLQAKLESSKSELKKAQLAQKRFKAVAMLSIGMFVISLISITLYQNNKQLGQDLSDTQIELSNTQENLNDTRGQLDYKNNELTLTEASLNTAKKKINDLTTALKQQADSIERLNNQYLESQSSLLSEQHKVSNLERQLSQANSAITDLTNQNTKLSSQSSTISSQDIKFTLYDIKQQKWSYPYYAPVWNIEKNNRSNEYQIFIQYKGTVVASQMVAIK